MSKQFVVETLICANCAHFIERTYSSRVRMFCDYHDVPASPRDPFCLGFDGQPLLLVGRETNGVTYRGFSQLVI